MTREVRPGWFGKACGRGNGRGRRALEAGAGQLRIEPVPDNLENLDCS